MPELRDLPAIESLLQSAAIADLIQCHGTQVVKAKLRELQQTMRTERVVPDWGVEAQGYAKALTQSLSKADYTPVFNLTGTVIHTNLGRALLSQTLWRDVEPLVTRPMNLEYDLVKGVRGQRETVVEQRLSELINCEAVTIVNNCAAALMLVLNTFGLRAQVPVSRGELVEIGGSFRLPELMSRAGCDLVEVGTTNRTRLSDYAAVAGSASMLLKIHPSNYHIEGFTESVEAPELAGLAKEYGIPSCVDLGSGSLVDLSQWGLPKEPTPQSVLDQGVDLVTFSGDKLLGSVQCGIIAGRKELIEQIRSNPMKRALRADKVTMAILNATLKLYNEPQQLPEHLPLLKTLTLSQDALRSRAKQLIEGLPEQLTGTLIESEAQIGSGALPDQTIDSIGVILQHPSFSAQKLADALRRCKTPIIGRIKADQVILDMRGADPLDELIINIQSLDLMP
ncbi:MAG: L-seryl-tRNA(Sec) selenium transferase [Pseudomonadales bacterium]|nr:L-seryl-tRNA(Sec) selenium transferase [Pseudomonadales bacterium]